MPLFPAGFTCREVVDRSSAFLDDEMTWSEWVRFRLHLLGCPPCARYVSQLGITVDVLRRLGGEEGRDTRSQVLDLFDDWASGQLPAPDGASEE